jgi:hypothetical protein
MLRCALHDTFAGHFEKAGLKVCDSIQFLRLPDAMCHSEALADESGEGVASGFLFRCFAALCMTLSPGILKKPG